MPSLGEKIKKLRIQKGLTQSELGMGLVTPSMISQIEADKANPSYKVLERLAKRLDEPLSVFLSDIDTELHDSSKYKVAEAFMSANDYASALPLLESIRDYPNSLVHYCDVALKIGECYYHTQKYEKALEVLEEVVARTKSENEYLKCALALHKLGLVEVARQKYNFALFHLMKAFETFEMFSLVEPFLQAEIAIQLGTVLNITGEIEEAIRYFEFASSLAKTASNNEVLAQTYLGLAQSYLGVKEWQKASEFAAHAHVIYQGQNRIKQSIDVRKKLILLSVKQTGDFTQAVRGLVKVYSDYRAHNFVNEAIITKGEIAVLYLQKGAYQRCLEACEEAIAESDHQEHQQHLHQIKAPILKTQGKVFAKLGQYHQAIQCLQAALLTFEAHEMLFEIGETCAVLSEIYEAQGDFENSIMCLRKVKSTYESTLMNRGICG